MGGSRIAGMVTMIDMFKVVGKHAMLRVRTHMTTPSPYQCNVFWAALKMT